MKTYNRWTRESIQGAGEDIEGLLEGIVYNPPSHVIGTMNAGVKVSKDCYRFYSREYE